MSVVTTALCGGAPESQTAFSTLSSFTGPSVAGLMKVEGAMPDHATKCYFAGLTDVYAGTHLAIRVARKCFRHDTLRNFP